MTRFLYILGFLWSLPVTLIGIVIGLVYLPRSIAIDIWPYPLVSAKVTYILPAWAIAQTYGAVVLYKDRLDPLTSRHEARHIKQCMVLGPFILLAYPIATFIAYIKTGRGYENNWFERDARRAASIDA